MFCVGLVDITKRCCNPKLDIIKDGFMKNEAREYLSGVAHKERWNQFCQYFDALQAEIIDMPVWPNFYTESILQGNEKQSL